MCVVYVHMWVWMLNVRRGVALGGSTHNIMRIVHFREAIFVHEAGIGQWSICVHDLLPLGGKGRREERGGGFKAIYMQEWA